MTEHGGEKMSLKKNIVPQLQDLDSESVNTNIVILNSRLQFKGSSTESWGSEAPDKRANAPPGGKCACSAAVPLNLTLSPFNKQYKIRKESLLSKESEIKQQQIKKQPTNRGRSNQRSLL